MGSYPSDLGLRLHPWCPMNYLLSTHLLTLEGWTAELAFGLWLRVLTMQTKPTQVNPTGFESLRLYHSTTPSLLTEDIA